MTDRSYTNAVLVGVFTVIGFGMLVYPFAFPRSLDGPRMFVVVLGGFFCLALAAQFASGGVMKGDAIRFQG